MSNQNITNFENFNESFETLDTSGIVNKDFKNQLFDVIPKFFNYEEEGIKLNFDVLILKNIEMIKEISNISSLKYCNYKKRLGN